MPKMKAGAVRNDIVNIIYVLDENGERVPLIDKKTGQQKVDNRNRKQWKCLQQKEP